VLHQISAKKMIVSFCMPVAIPLVWMASAWLLHLRFSARLPRRFGLHVGDLLGGHRSIANTVVYTAVADKRVRNIWGK
jgi:hypothetical protein